MFSSSNVRIPLLRLLSLALCVLAAVWCMPGVIALRTTAVVVALLVVILLFPEWKQTLSRLPKPVYAWMLFIAVYPFIFSENLALCLKVFRNQWYWTIILPMLGLAAGTLLSNRKNQLALFGVAFVFPILTQVFLGLKEIMRTHAFPYGFWGLHHHHDYFGYTAIHAISILGPLLIFSPRKSTRTAAVLVICLSVFSTILAASRAGLSFVLLTTLATVFVSLWVKTSPRLRHRILVMGLPVMMLFLTGVGTLAYRNDKTRWARLQTRLAEGFQGDALKIVGEGPLVDGDTARPLIARAAWTLAKYHPWGLDGTRQAYQTAMKRIYPQPVNNLDHSHNGWLDTCIALGYLGGALYFIFLLSFAFEGFSRLLSSALEVRATAVSLVVLAAIWVLRGCFDSTFRDHMLQMQVFTLPFLYAFLLSSETRQEEVMLGSVSMPRDSAPLPAI